MKYLEKRANKLLDRIITDIKANPSVAYGAVGALLGGFAPRILAGDKDTTNALLGAATGGAMGALVGDLSREGTPISDKNKVEAIVKAKAEAESLKSNVPYVLGGVGATAGGVLGGSKLLNHIKDSNLLRKTVVADLVKASATNTAPSIHALANALKSGNVFSKLYRIWNAPRLSKMLQMITKTVR